MVGIELIMVLHASPSGRSARKYLKARLAQQLTACTRSSRSVLESLDLWALRSLLHSHSLTPLGQPMARQCSPWVRIQATV